MQSFWFVMPSICIVLFLQFKGVQYEGLIKSYLKFALDFMCLNLCDLKMDIKYTFKENEEIEKFIERNPF